MTGKVPTNLPAIIDGQGVKTHPVEKEPITDKTDYNRLHDEKVAREAQAERTAAEVHNWVQKYVEADRKKNAQQRLDEAARKGINQVDTSRVITPTAPESFWSRLQSALTRTVSESEAERIMSMNREQQARMRAQRLEMFGENRGRNLTDTGDKASVKRTKQLFGWIYKNDGTNKELFQDVRLTPGFNKEETINTTKILDSLNRVLSGPEMFKAQTGGTLRNIVGSFTAYLGMPSIEKSRAEAEGLNQVMANVRNEVLKLVQSIQAKEMALKGMQEMGTAKFDSQGMITTDSSSAAQKTFIDLEEQKGVLRGALAEVQMIDTVVGSTGGKISQIVKKLGFIMPELMENNTILQNINAGLDKNGKALKFQTRTGEILNYSFQLLSRHIGQIVKNWLWMVNPINLIKRAFQDFASYDVKWQRTMNVIKYNLRRIIKPFMEWLAQQIVNLIGLVNALIKGIGSAFGHDWDLFDKDAANAEKINEQLQEASETSAGFDELHDIGSSSTSENSADNLLGDIYTPQWDGLNKVLEDIGKTIGNIVDAVSDWNFWNWLAIGGAALAGFLILRTLLSWFKGKSNPLQTVAKGFSFLEKAVGWAILIWAFTEFTKVLTDFIETVGKMKPEEVWQAFSVLAASFGVLVVAIGLLMGAAKLFGGGNWLNSLGIAAIVASFALLTVTFAHFFDTIKSMSSDQINQALGALAIGLGTVTLAITALLLILTAVISTGVGALAIVALAAVLAVIALIIVAMADFIRALGEAGDGIKLILEGISTVVDSIAEGIVSVITAIGESIMGIVETIANGVKTVLEPILQFMDNVSERVTDLAKTIAHEIGETIRTVIKTTGDVIIGVIEALLNAIPRLLDSILNFAGRIGPAIENSVDSIIRSVTKLINFMVSGVEYLVNLVVSGVNGIINSINSVSKYVGISIPNVSPVTIQRFYPQYEQGTNYVPNDGLAYLHEGEAVVPKKYNQPLQNGLTAEERNYMYQMMSTLRSLDNTMKQGIPVNGQFVQRGSDLVAVVNRTNSRTGADLLSNVAYAR